MNEKPKRNSDILAGFWKPTPQKFSIGGNIFDVFNVGIEEDGISIMSIDVQASVDTETTSRIRGIVNKAQEPVISQVNQWLTERGCLVQSIRVDMDRGLQTMWFGNVPILKPMLSTIEFDAVVLTEMFI